MRTLIVKKQEACRRIIAFVNLDTELITLKEELDQVENLYKTNPSSKVINTYTKIKAAYKHAEYRKTVLSNAENIHALYLEHPTPEMYKEYVRLIKEYNDNSDKKEEFNKQIEE